MATMNISLPEPLKEFVDICVREQGYGTSSEYIRELVRNDQIRRAEQRLAALILEGLESGPPMPGDETYWSNRRATLQRKLSTP